MGKMLAARGHAGETTVRLESIDIPEIGDDDVLVKIVSAGTAPGLFALLAAGMLKPLPMTLGHEGAGTVAAVGRDVREFAAGHRVRIYPTLNCGRCRYCLSDKQMMCDHASIMGFVAFGLPVASYDRYHDGCFAEYMRVPQSQLDHLPDNVSFDVGAKIQDIATAVRCLKTAALPAAGTLMILAATGSLGTATIKLAKHYGVARLILVGRSHERLVAASRLSGLSTDIVAFDRLGKDWPERRGLARQIMEILPKGADAIIDYTPSGTDHWQVMPGLAKGGTFVHLGGNKAPCPLPMVALIQNCWRIAGTRNNSRIDSYEVLDLLSKGLLQAEDLITHRFSLQEFDKAVQSMQSRTEPMWMSVINP
jgi:threonine dehydrogenase-like Zn-dependent dehydrogenase